jgi:hypothetical protein
VALIQADQVQPRNRNKRINMGTGIPINQSSSQPTAPFCCSKVFIKIPPRMEGRKARAKKH